MLLRACVKGMADPMDIKKSVNNNIGQFNGDRDWNRRLMEDVNLERDY
jgi:hypothetical protein